MVDTSGSTAKDLKYESDSASRFFHILLGEGNLQDAAALYTFNWEIREQQPYTRDLRALDARLKIAPRFEAGTSLYDAIYLGGGRLEIAPGPQGHGDYQRWRQHYQQSYDIHKALEAAQLADAVIYPLVVMPITSDAGRNIGGENALTFMAERTGGRTFLPALGKQLDKAFDDIITELRTEYYIGLLSASRAAYQGAFPFPEGAASKIRNCGCPRATAIMGMLRTVPASRAIRRFPGSPASYERSGKNN